MPFLFVRISSNRKTGPMPVTYSHRDTCPPACKLKDSGCYAEHGPVSWVWGRTNGAKAIDLETLCNHIRRLPSDTLWRHNIAGDLPGAGNRLYPDQFRLLAAAAMHTHGFTFTHKPLTQANRRILRQHLDSQLQRSRKQKQTRGLTVNISTDSISEADAAVDADVGPVVTVLPSDAPRISRTPAGRKVIACPAEDTHLNCTDCGWCNRAQRDWIVGFRAHGARQKTVNLIARESPAQESAA